MMPLLSMLNFEQNVEHNYNKTCKNFEFEEGSRDHNKK